MEPIGCDDELLEQFGPNFSILNSVLSKIEIASQNFSLIITLDFKLMYPRDKFVRILFQDVGEFHFNHDASSDFYNVERVKFFKTEDSFYISLDPFDESDYVNESDNDMIICRHIRGYAL